MFTGFALLVFIPVALAQLSNVVVVDFEGAVVGSAEGKRASEKFEATVKAKQNELGKKQQELDDQTKKLQNGARTLSDEAKSSLQRDIDRRTTELQRLNEDAQKELSLTRDELLRPIADRASAILNAMAAELNYTLVIDISNPETNVIWKNPKNDVTEELIKRIDASAPKEPAKPAAAPATNKPTQPATKPTTPAPPK
jgi:outer membrane protein